MVDVQNIQFGSFTPLDSVSQLHDTIYALQEEKKALIHNLIARENILQEEKDDFVSKMSMTLYKKSQTYDQLYNQYSIIENLNTSLKKEVDNLTSALETQRLEYESKMKTILDAENVKYDALNSLVEKTTAELKQLKNKPAPTPPPAPPAPSPVKTDSIGIGCSLDSERIDAMENAMKKSAQMIESLTKNIEEEQIISLALRSSITEKVKVLHRERDLRIDFEYITNTLRMYIEVEMMKLNTEMNVSGFSSFAVAAFNMYKDYCDGALEKLVADAINERKKSPRSSKNLFPEFKGGEIASPYNEESLNTASVKSKPSKKKGKR